MKIGISGASGKFGKSVLAALLAQGGEHQIVAISRTPGSADGKIETRLGDYDRPETLASAYSGLDRLLLIPTADFAPGARSRQSKAAVQAAVAAGVGHIVILSSPRTKAAADPALAAAYWVAEQTLIAKAPAWTILRMNYFAESLADELRMAGEHAAIVGLGENKVAFVARDDVAAAAAGMLLSEGHHGAIYNLTGPAAISGAERAAIATKITGRPFSFQPLPEAVLRGGLANAGLPDGIADIVIDIQTMFVEGAMNIVTGDIEKLSGSPARPLEVTLAAAWGE
jgi:NAD(P)H dehydrogenase (quinone)